MLICWVWPKSTNINRELITDIKNEFKSPSTRLKDSTILQFEPKGENLVLYCPLSSISLCLLIHKILRTFDPLTPGTETNVRQFYLSTGHVQGCLGSQWVNNISVKVTWQVVHFPIYFEPRFESLNAKPLSLQIHFKT